jgi:glycosyltransferase involved in cell wall biosynthesis
LQPDGPAMAPRVSIVIPCYQQAHFLPDAIESALGQAYSPREVIVVDDGATDTTVEVAAGYPDVRCLRQANQGLAAARNAGLHAGHGEYVVFLDADDRLLPGALEAGAAALEAHPTAAFAVGRHRRISADGVPLPTPLRPRVRDDFYASLVRRCWMGVAEVMYRRCAVIAVGGFDRRLRYAEDYDLYLRLTRRYPIVDHYTLVSEYRQSAGSLSRHADRMLGATLDVLAPHHPVAASSPALRAAWRERLNAVWYYDRLLEAALDDLAGGRWLAGSRRLAIFARHLPRHRTYARRRLLAPLRRVRPAAAAAGE